MLYLGAVASKATRMRPETEADAPEVVGGQSSFCDEPVHHEGHLSPYSAGIGRWFRVVHLIGTVFPSHQEYIRIILYNANDSLFIEIQECLQKSEMNGSVAMQTA